MSAPAILCHSDDRPRRERGAKVEPAGPTLEEIRSWPAAVELPLAATALQISRSWAYQLAAQGEFPCKTIAIRGRRLALTASLVSLLETGEP